MTNVTTILLGLILVLGGVITVYFLPFLRSKLTVDQMTTLKAIVRTVVFAAEQLFGAKMGTDKKAYAIKVAKEMLAKIGLTFDDEAIDAAIEAQVKEMNIEIGAVKQ